MKNTTRYSRRLVSRNQKRVEALNPCSRYSASGGINPFAMILERLSLMKQLEGHSAEDAEKKALHQIKMQTEQKSAKARQQRKRNKV